MRKKIVEIIPQMNSGGAERFVTDLCNELIKQHDVTLIVFFSIDTHGFYLDELNNNVKVISLNKKLGIDLMLPFKIWKIIKREKPSIVHTHLGAFYYCLLSVILMTRRLKFFHTVHNDAFVEAPRRIGIIVKKVIFKFNLVKAVTISKSSLASYGAAYGFEATMIENGRAICLGSEHIEKIRHEIKKYRKTENTILFINIARLSIQKNHKLLIDSFNYLIKNGFDVALLIIGSPLDRQILQFVNSNCNDRIFYLGEKKNPVDYLILSDAFCLSSVAEGMPISLIECFAIGRIPICTPAGGVVDMISNNENGFVSADFTLLEFVACLKEFIFLSSEKKIQMIENIKRDSHKYTISHCAEQYERCFEIFSGVN